MGGKVKGHNSMVENYFAAVGEMGGKDLLFARIIYEIAPVLIGVKPSSIMTFSACSRNMADLWDEYKYYIRDATGAEWFEMKRSDFQITVLFYVSKQLAKMLHKRETREFLRLQGYPDRQDILSILTELKSRLEKEIPHEMGIILGIPVKDVKGYIEKKGCGALFCGYWKVYHNPGRAEKLFRHYDNIRAKIMLEFLATTACNHGNGETRLCCAG